MTNRDNPATGETDPDDSLAAPHDVAGAFARTYDELRVMARRHLRGEQAGHTLVTTALVHEAYLRLAGRTDLDAQEDATVLAAASAAMRRVLIDHARRRLAQKRDQVGGSPPGSDPVAAAAAQADAVFDLLALDRALTELGARDPRMQQVVECRFFGGLSPQETARALATPLRTVERDWKKARAYLVRSLAAEEEGAG
jgi:RNA polymerase sigma-70 factor, ECF subfamily